MTKPETQFRKNRIDKLKNIKYNKYVLGDAGVVQW